MFSLRQAAEIFDELAELCGASASVRDSFMHTLVSGMVEPPVEFRFQGDLGFGGKFRVTRDRVYVDCYPEDRNDERDRAIRAMNAWLAVQEWE